MCSPGAVALIWCWGIRRGSRWSGTRPASWAKKIRCLPFASSAPLNWRKLRAEAFAQFPELAGRLDCGTGRGRSHAEFSERARRTTRCSRACKANLYKCFLPLGWRLAGSQGVAGYLHPEGPYDDPKGGALREALYPRLRAHFQFMNELQLFAEVDHHTKYSINLYGPPRDAARL